MDNDFILLLPADNVAELGQDNHVRGFAPIGLRPVRPSPGENGEMLE